MHEHDKIAQRLGMLLTRLYSGEKLHLHELAAEYNVTLRTLQRDFNERLSYLPIESQPAILVTAGLFAQQERWGFAATGRAVGYC